MSMNTKTLIAGRFLRLVERGGWEYVERTNASGVVAIAAVTEDGRLLLVQQDRRPVGGPVIELPAGLCGDDAGARGEPLGQAACRELLEETGYEVPGGEECLEPLLTVASSAGLTSEVVTVVGARGVRKVAAGGGVGGENIQVHAPPLEDVRRWLLDRARGGVLVDAKVFVGLDFALRGR
jgi:ADP-ribose pyrophosphatase